MAMARTAVPIAEKNPFLTSKHLAPSDNLSHESGTSPGSQYDTDEYEEGLDAREGSECSEGSAESEYAVDEAVRDEMNKLENTFREIGMRFRMIARIGEGIARKLVSYLYYLNSPLTGPLGTFSTVYKAEDLHYEYYENDWDAEQKGAPKWSSPPLKRRKDTSSLSANHDQRQRPKRRFVAIKKIYVTSSPIRIQNELELLHDLRGCRSVCPLITACRHQDQVVAVLPHFRHQDFRVSHVMAPARFRN